VSNYLREKQYKTPQKLTARADLHRRYSTNPEGWLAFVLRQLDLRAGLRVLEVGGGPGWLWWQHPERVPAGMRVTVSDFSAGMVREARSRLAAGARDFHFAQLDAQALPFAAWTFDRVTANHMLYHVPDLGRAVAELRRVLRPGGFLCAATNGPEHLKELYALAAEHSLWAETTGEAVLSYQLDNAEAVLGQAFERVAVRRYADALWVTAAQPVVEYLASMASYADLEKKVSPEELRREIQARIDKEGGLRIAKDAGVVLAFAE
jgi:ubiquinone/menaquinone biosynthesis C-methylase UbiE